MEAGKVPGRVEVEACTVGKGKVVHIIIIQYIPTFVRSLELEKMSCVKFVLILDTVFTYCTTFMCAHSYIHILTCIDNSIHVLCTPACVPLLCTLTFMSHALQAQSTQLHIGYKRKKNINYVNVIYVKSKYSSAKNKHTFPIHLYSTGQLEDQHQIYSLL